jgi:hypothetical protein
MEHDEPIVLHSVKRHGVAEEDAQHAWACAIDAYEVDDGMVMYIGPARSGALLEVGVIDWHGTLAIAHAMPARDKFLR